MEAQEDCNAASGRQQDGEGARDWAARPARACSEHRVQRPETPLPGNAGISSPRRLHEEAPGLPRPDERQAQQRAPAGAESRCRRPAREGPAYHSSAMLFSSLAAELSVTICPLASETPASPSVASFAVLCSPASTTLERLSAIALAAAAALRSTFEVLCSQRLRQPWNRLVRNPACCCVFARHRHLTLASNTLPLPRTRRPPSAPYLSAPLLLHRCALSTALLPQSVKDRPHHG
ncbi:hypothetical protein K491DRAFT_163247 [Lophiostoma macrostomum CBS 122681]|uniref:Uncharacterized protein n=1 Tax=Lophiostoma macrostomum CBS 122681 TaxID=1314788 RepID=A0A6A6THM6_9PLEO|nr:hypothetical protein K491DRAFT_163247 [Lophiostoma macrostomum CBS 122681]